MNVATPRGASGPLSASIQSTYSVVEADWVHLSRESKAPTRPATTCGSRRGGFGDLCDQAITPSRRDAEESLGPGVSTSIERLRAEDGPLPRSREPLRRHGDQRRATLKAGAAILSAMKIWGSSLILKIGKTSLKALGIAPAVSLSPEGPRRTRSSRWQVHLGSPKATSSDGAVTLSLEHLRVPGMPGPTAAKIHLAWDGDPHQAMALKDGTFALGPFDGTVRGTLLAFEGGFRLDSSLESRSVPALRSPSNRWKRAWVARWEPRSGRSPWPAV